MPGDNDVIIEAWNTVLFDKFSRFKHLLIDGLAAHSREALVRAGYHNGMRVLDIGCGFGDSTCHIARLVGPAGRAVGVDCAPRFVESARAEAAAEGVPNAEFVVADVQADDLRGPYDAAFSRFGTMFFNLPGAAFRNVRKSLQPGGELFMIVWRRREENPWLHDAELCVRELVPVVSHEDTDQVHCGPGPFSMAGPDMVSGLLRSAGYTRIAFERFDADICIGRDLDEAIEFAMALGPAGEIMRLAEEAASQLRPVVEASLRRRFEGLARPGGIVADSSVWIVHGTRRA
jgi:ubiquinone/menaquinone biosynthesis C-methylase UbiE